jgi:hypothetical protein
VTILRPYINVSDDAFHGVNVLTRFNENLIACEKVRESCTNACTQLRCVYLIETNPPVPPLPTALPISTTTSTTTASSSSPPPALSAGIIIVAIAVAAIAGVVTIALFIWWCVEISTYTDFKIRGSYNQLLSVF